MCKKTDGDEVCINGDEIDSLLQNTANTPDVKPEPSESEVSNDIPPLSDANSSSTEAVITEEIIYESTSTEATSTAITP